MTFEQLPQNKTLYVWKKLDGGDLAYLRIPRTARRTATHGSNKCRAERAVVLRIIDKYRHNKKVGYSYNYNMKYEVGKTVKSKNSCGDLSFDENPYNICTTGIHFFLTREEAKNYYWI